MIKIKSGLWEIFDGKNFRAVVVFRFEDNRIYVFCFEKKEVFNVYHVLTQHDILCSLH